MRLTSGSNRALPILPFAGRRYARDRRCSGPDADREPPGRL